MLMASGNSEHRVIEQKIEATLLPEGEVESLRCFAESLGKGA